MHLLSGCSSFDVGIKDDVCINIRFVTFGHFLLPKCLDGK